MQFRLPVAIAIFLGSYLPLSLILLAQDYNYDMASQRICWQWFYDSKNCTLPFGNPKYSISIFASCLVCFIATLSIVRLTRPKRIIEINEAKYVPSDLMNYTLPYVVSFMSIEYHETGKFVGLIIFLGWMFWITHKSGQVILNPLLIAFGWRLYDIAYKFPGSSETHSSIALANGRISANEQHRHTIIQDVVIIKIEKEH